MKLYITFSGLDGSGKSEQIRLLSQALKDIGVKHAVIYSRIGRNANISRVRYVFGRLLRHTNNLEDEKRAEAIRALAIRAFAQLSIWDTLLHYALIYRAQSNGCEIVLCDRYLLDSYVDLIALYASHAANMRSFALLRMASPVPAISFLLEVSASLAYEREMQRPNSFVESIETIEDRERLYRDLAEKGEWDIVLDGSMEKHAIHERVFEEVASLVLQEKATGERSEAPWAPCRLNISTRRLLRRV